MKRDIYRKLMFAGILPWRQGMVKKHFYTPPEKILLKNGWEYTNPNKVSSINNGLYKLMYKIISGPIDLPNVLTFKEFIQQDKYKFDPLGYKFVEIILIDIFDGSAIRYAKGNVYVNSIKPFIINGSQLVRCHGDPLPVELTKLI